MNKSKIIYSVLIVNCIIAIGLFVYLTQQHWALKLGTMGGQSLCNVSKVFNCDVVSGSKYSQLFGIPLSLLGANTFGVILLLALSQFFMQSSKLSRYIVYISGFTVVMSVIMAIVSLSLLQHLCLFCIFTYICSIIALICALAAKSDKLDITEDIRSLFQDYKIVLGLMIAIPLMAFIINDNAHGKSFQQLKEMAEAEVAYFDRQEANIINTVEPIKFGASDENAKFTIVEFADPLCPHCKFASYPLKAFVLSKPDVQLRYQHFPLSGNCNDAIKMPGRGQCKLVKAVYCSGKLASKDKEALQKVFDEQGNLMPDDVSKIFAKDFGIEQTKLEECMEAETTQEVIKAQAKVGQDLKIRGTPSIYWNGRAIRSGARIPILEALYKNNKK